MFRSSVPFLGDDSDEKGFELPFFFQQNQLVQLDPNIFFVSLAVQQHTARRAAFYGRQLSTKSSLNRSR